MANASNAQYDFRGGEWSPLAQGRMDDPRYKTAMKVCYNSYPTEEGAWTRRAGTRHIASSRGGVGKLLKFTFNQMQPYSIELTAGHMRFINGTGVALGTDTTTVTSISTATPAVLTIPAVTWATDDQVIFTYGDNTSKLALSHLCNRTFALAKLTPTTFSLYDAITGAPVDGTLVAWVSGLNARVGKIQDLATPWSTALVPSCRIVQAERTALVLQGNTKPQIVAVTTLPSTTTDGQFSITPSSFLDGPYLDPFPGSTVAPSATIGLVNITLGFQAYVATKAYKTGDYVNSGGSGYRSLVDANVGNTPASSPTFWTPAAFGEPVGPNGFTATDVGRAVRLYNSTAAAAYVGGTTYSQGDMVTSSSIGYRSLVSNNTGNTPASSPTFWEVLAPGWTWGRITGLSSTGLLPSGIGYVGDAVGNAGLASAFNGTASKVASLCAQSGKVVSVSYATVYGYDGRDYGSSPQAVASVVVYPASDIGYAINQTGFFGYFATNVTLTLYGKNTAPASPTDGTVLGSTSGVLPNSTAPTTITSNDPVTTYRYSWVTMQIDVVNNPVAGTAVYFYFSQLQFYNSSGGAGSIASVQILGNPLPNTNTITSWRLGAYSDTTGWPTTGCYHEGRFWLSGAIANRLDASNSNDLFNFAPTNTAGVVGDSNAISATFNSAKTNTIMWMKPDLQGIVCGTQEGEYLLQASAANQVMTPANIQGHLVTHYGCANVEPVQTGITTMFVQSHGRRIHEYLSDIFSGRFFAPNATERAKHITAPGISELAYQEELTPIVWARKTDGLLAGSTYRRVSLSSSAEPVFNGWHQHVLGSARTVESLVSGPSIGGTLDAITMITNDAETGIRHIEIMEPMFEEEDKITDARFVDDAITPSAAASVIIDNAPGLRLYGLWHLNGKRVAAWIGGVDCGDFPVTDGYIDVPYAGLFTRALLTKLSTSGTDFGSLAVVVDAGLLTIPAVVGFTFTSRGQIVRPNDPQATGARQGPAFGKNRRSHKFAALFHNAQGVKVGTDFTSMKPVLFSTPGGTRLPANVLFSGMHKDTLTDKSSDNPMDGMVAWEISRPYPATVAAIGTFLSTQDE